MIKMNLLESCTGENVVGIADMYKRLNEISPRWTNAGENRTDFIACGSFIRGDCYDLTDEEYTLIHTSYYERTSAVIAYSEAQSKADKICSDYTLFITPENINELSKFDGAAVKNLRCYLSEDGLDLAPLTKIKTYMWAGPSYNDTSYIFVSRTPANSEFIDMVNGVENFSGRLSYWKGNATGFYNCDIITDCELPLNFYMGNCDITLEKPLSGMVNTATFKSCRFDRIPDFSKLTVSIDASNPYITDNWADFTFNNPGQKATGFEKMTFEADTDIYLNGDIDIPNFDFLKNKIYDHIVEINSTGNINIEDLIMNDYDFKGISFIDCATKEQFDRLVKKYPDNYVSVEINEVLFEHGNKPLNF